ncbi:MAG: hypothetical protein PHI76_02395 [Clostridia bacterium]|nr:hypothetical protein [Clostridia bacterium]
MLLKYKKLFYKIIASFCFLILGVCFLSASDYSQKITVMADDINNVTYFSAKVNTAPYTDGQTIFLNNGQTLAITFGKPIGEPHEGTVNTYSSNEQIGDYMLSYLTGFSMEINGSKINYNYYNLADKFSVEKYIYAPDYPNQTYQEEREYFTMNINLADTDFFPSGEYVLSFSNYVEHSGTDYAISMRKDFLVTFYIFNTTDYFSSDSATNAKIEMLNTRMVAKLDTTYKNYYYFNYSNYTTTSTSFNYLPEFNFNANKFTVEIFKSYQGVTVSCTVSKFVENYVKLEGTTSSNFLEVTYNSETNNLSINFKDLGEYIIKYNFIYTKSDDTFVYLTNSNLDDFKNDMLYVYGYQLFYFDINEQQKNEFKEVYDAKCDFTSSADVSYLLSYASLKNSAESDTEMFAKLNLKTAVSTNQPVISVKYNTKLKSEHSYYYVWDTETNDWEKQNDIYLKNTYTNGSFADAGTYLLKTVYSYDNNYNSSGITAPGELFTQYFYFTISNTIASFSVKELVTDEVGNTTENVLSTNSYTQNPVNVVLGAQGIFNSDIRIDVSAKNYGLVNYTTIATLIGSTDEQVYNFTSNLNYKVTLYFGLNKMQVSYFTIDNTNFENVKILNVKKSTSTSNYYVKSNEIDFFTNQAVTVQWKEKLSGASSKAYFKYIPFLNTGHIQPNSNQFITDNALPTNFSLDFQITDTLFSAKHYNSQGLTLVTDRYIFSEQGFYIIYLVDDAGNWQYVPFCIDKTEMTIWQYSYSLNQYQSPQRYNVVSSDTRLEWGKYKLINLNIDINQLENIADKWVKDVIKSKYNNESDNDIFLSQFYNGKLYFASEINSIMYLQEGSSFVKLTNTYSYRINLNETIENTTLVIEMTYVFHFIDESNPNFNSAGSLSNEDFANLASKNYRITTSSDASKSDILINTLNTSADNYSNLNYNSDNLSQAGFTDSHSYDSVYETYNDSIDTRSKYFYTTGVTLNGNISLLSYIFIANPSTLITVEKVAIYYYSYEITENWQFKLSDTAIETVIYDAVNNIDLTTLISGGDFSGFQAYNLNTEYNLATNSHQTKEGKYIVVRTYSDESNVDAYDYLIRESVFMVDRQNIVSSPVSVGEDYMSIIGQYIYINVLNGDINNVKFNDIYMAYYNDNYILETNKLPVVSFVPVSKYGSGTDDNFIFYDVMQYFYTMTSDTEQNYYLKRFQYDSVDEKSILGLSYFGRGTLTTQDFNFPTKLKYINNTSFDLTVKIDYAYDINGERSNIYNKSDSQNGYFTSGNFKDEGFYFVTLTQNYANGYIHPNVRNSFSFVFYISKSAPQFEFLDSNDEILNNVDNSDYNVSYTNANTIKVAWSDPTSPYMAKIDIIDSGSGKTNGIYYYTSADPLKRYLSVQDIVTDGLNHYFTLNISNFANSTIVYVYMEYEGNVRNDYSSIIKALYIDRLAPTSTLNTLLASTTVNGTNVGSYSRVYVDQYNQQTLTEKKYNVTVSSGPLAFYTYAVELTNENLLKLFNTQNATNNYFTEGYYYYALNIGSADNLKTVTNITSAKHAYSTHTVPIILTQINAGSIYEIVEQDLAGNISIYTVYFFNKNPDGIVLEFEKQETDVDKRVNYKYSELEQTQNIFAKDNFKVLNVNLHNYKWTVLDVNGIIYLNTPYMDENNYYDISNWADLSATPNILNIENFLSFNSSRNIQKLIINEPCQSYNYTFNISVTNEVLTSSSLIEQEGIKVNGNSYSGGIFIRLASMSIYSWENQQYKLIYENTGTFTSNNNVAYASATNSWIFTITDPVIAYKYVFTDNYGESYIYYHTFGEPVIEEQIVGDVDEIPLPDESGSGSNLWNVGFDNISFYYSNVDYYIYMNVEYLEYNLITKSYSWKTFDPAGATTEYGTLITSGMSSIYYNCFNVSGKPSINCVNLLAQASTLDLDNFNGGIAKFTITLVNVNENPAVALENVIHKRIMINNLNPKIELFDKNNDNKTSLFEGNSLFSGQLKIRYSTLNYDNPAMFSTHITMQFENADEVAFDSGLSVSTPGSYLIKTYITIEGIDYLYKSQGFIISESSTDFYKLLTYNSQIGMWEEKQSTGKKFEYDNKSYSTHYIVNTENYKISIDEEQDIEVTELDFVYNIDRTTTRFYNISNLGSTSTSIKYYEKIIAITYVYTENLLTNIFYYTGSDQVPTNLKGISTQIVTTTVNQKLSTLTIGYHSYYGIKENIVNVSVKINVGGNEVDYTPIKSILTNNTNTITLTEAGTYTVYFNDQAGNIHNFIDEIYGYPSKSYEIVYVNGVMYQINGNQPIENGIYNDEVRISLPESFNSLYDAGGKPIINVKRNGEDYTSNVSKEKISNDYILNVPGYYEVYFSAKIDSYDVRHQKYSFTILDSTEAGWAFEYSEYANYEIISVKKNQTLIDLSNYFNCNTYTIKVDGANTTVKYLKNILISLYDEITGAGQYEITIRTNVGVTNQTFTFSFNIRDTGTIPIKISVPEGTATSDIIIISFNAADLYNKLGTCRIFIDDKNFLLIDSNYIENLLPSDYNRQMKIESNGIKFIQVVTPSGKVLYSYKIIKQEPLNAISIIIIVSSVLAVTALTVTVLLLRRRMKIR